MSRRVDWVEQDLNSDTLLWRQAKREEGQFPPEYTDRRSDFSKQVETKKATKKKPAEVSTMIRYSLAEKVQMKKAFEPLIEGLKSRYGAFSWWHYDFPSGTLMYGSANQRQQVHANDLVKLADRAFKKFTQILSKVHGHAIAPEVGNGD